MHGQQNVTHILTSTTVIIECISWLIKVTDNNDVRWKPEILRTMLHADDVTERRL